LRGGAERGGSERLVRMETSQKERFFEKKGLGFYYILWGRGLGQKGAGNNCRPVQAQRTGFGRPLGPSLFNGPGPAAFNIMTQYFFVIFFKE